MGLFKLSRQESYLIYTVWDPRAKPGTLPLLPHLPQPHVNRPSKDVTRVQEKEKEVGHNFTSSHRLCDNSQKFPTVHGWLF